MKKWEKIEIQRIELQSALDNKKSQAVRNRLGQFSTPTILAREIVAHATGMLARNEKIRFFDPAIGTGSFYSALMSLMPSKRVESAFGFEIDPHYGEPARDIWSGTLLDLRIEDFTQEEPKACELANLLVCNPPYVRHHHISGSGKSQLQLKAERSCGVKINGLSGLYCYFMGLSHKWMREGAIAAWLVPSEFMDVNYGTQLKQYLLNKVTLLQIHRFDPEDVQFTDALVSSAVIFFRNELPQKTSNVLFSFGGKISEPRISRRVSVSELTKEKKWTRFPKAKKALRQSSVTLGDLFEIKRGLATGDNSFFILTRDQIENLGLPFECFTPVLPGTRYIPTDEIEADIDGNPIVDKQLFLLDTRLPEEEIRERYPNLKSYLDTGHHADKAVSNRYLCRSRRPWYSQENRPPAPIVCTYMGRGREGKRPFRFILNHSQATACNVFLMIYPRPQIQKVIRENPEIIRAIWKFLNAVDPEKLIDHGRVYGGGLHKLEPKELRGFPADNLISKIPELENVAVQEELF